MVQLTISGEEENPPLMEVSLYYNTFELYQEKVDQWHAVLKGETYRSWK
ncbi:hypothetical protein R4Z10_10350 [Niallia sp. XMNu-256]